MTRSDYNAIAEFFEKANPDAAFALIKRKSIDLGLLEKRFNSIDCNGKLSVGQQIRKQAALLKPILNKCREAIQ